MPGTGLSWAWAHRSGAPSRMNAPPAQRADVLIRFSRQVSGLAQLAFTRNALVRLGRMFDPVLKLAAGSWRSFRHHVRSARCIDRSTGSGMKFHVVTDRKLVGHCLDPDCRLVTATLGSRTIAATKPANWRPTRFSALRRQSDDTGLASISHRQNHILGVATGGGSLRFCTITFFIGLFPKVPRPSFFQSQLFQALARALESSYQTARPVLPPPSPTGRVSMERGALQPDQRSLI